METVTIDSGTLAGVTAAFVTLASVIANFLPKPSEDDGAVKKFLLKAVSFFAGNIRVNSIK